MTKTVPIPEEYKNKLDRFEYLLSRTCANIGFFLEKHKEEPVSFDSQPLKRLYSQARAAAMDYLEMQACTKDDLIGKGSYIFARINTERKDHNRYLTVKNNK